LRNLWTTPLWVYISASFWIFFCLKVACNINVDAQGGFPLPLSIALTYHSFSLRQTISRGVHSSPGNIFNQSSWENQYGEKEARSLWERSSMLGLHLLINSGIISPTLFPSHYYPLIYLFLLPFNDVGSLSSCLTHSMSLNESLFISMFSYSPLSFPQSISSTSYLCSPYSLSQILYISLLITPFLFSFVWKSNKDFLVLEL